MKIKRIQVKNIGPYVNENAFDFDVSDITKRMVLIGGKNGAGKTTLFNAIKICLYGCVAYSFESNNAKYFAEIEKIINANEKLQKIGEAEVVIDLLMDDGKYDHTYTFVRSWRVAGKKIAETFTVYKDGETLSETEKSDFESYLLQTLPPNLFRFYFFDGEKISDFVFNSSKNSDFKDAFLKLCSLDTMEIIRENFRRISRSKAKGTMTLSAEYDRCLEADNLIAQRVECAEDEYREISNEILIIDQRLASLEKAYAKGGGISKKEWRSMQDQIAKEDARREGHHKWLKEMANNVLPFIILRTQLEDFVMHPDDSILILSRDARNLSKLLDLFDRLPGDYRNDTLFVFDEVHGAGSNTFVENLSGRLSPYRYRLGLSATPEREYDEAGNDFLLNEIGEVIFEFTLQDAIQKGILCEFNYIPLPYVLSDEEKLKKRKIIAAFNAKKESGEPVDEKDMFTQLALVNKTAVNKLEEFESLISQRPELLQKCIIFVQTMEYGAKLQEILVRYSDKYHTYYADDEKINLENFAAGKIDCLLTCKKVSEGIDISSVTNIILFSSDRSRLVTTQRIGRALRLDKNNPEKKATVVDFVIEDSEENDNNADADRAEWLTDLSQTRRCEHEK